MELARSDGAAAALSRATLPALGQVGFRPESTRGMCGMSPYSLYIRRCHLLWYTFMPILCAYRGLSGFCNCKSLHWLLVPDNGGVKIRSRFGGQFHAATRWRTSLPQCCASELHDALQARHVLRRHSQQGGPAALESQANGHFN